VFSGAAVASGLCGKQPVWGCFAGSKQVRPPLLAALANDLRQIHFRRVPDHGEAGSFTAIFSPFCAPICNNFPSL